MNDYTQTLNTTASAEAIYNALTTGIGKWWVEPQSRADTVGDTPTFTFVDTYWQMRVDELVENKKVVWTCIKSYLVDEKLPAEAEKEWEGNVLTWEISEGSLTMTQQGLTKKSVCAGVCYPGWDFFILDSLKCYLETGEGKPFVKEE